MQRAIASPLMRNMLIMPSEIIPVFSHHHVQHMVCDHHKMCRSIRHGISKNTNSLHSFRWSSMFQCTSSVIDLIHYAAKHRVQLLIDVNPNDVYARFLWKGIRHMYPDTHIFYTYRDDGLKDVAHDMQQQPDEITNVKLHTDDLIALPIRPQNLIHIRETEHIARPYRARWITNDFKQTDLLYIPLMT